MKKSIALFIFLGIFFSAYSQNAPATGSKKNKKITSATFSGRWKGAENCASAGAPLAFVTIVTSGSSAVLISGIYSIQGKVKGTIKADVLTIPLQQVNDPNFVNLAIEGTFTLSDDRKSITARFNVQNNETKDACTAVYQK